VTAISHCAFCKHARGPGCDAFPEKVPEAIWFGSEPHDRPVGGDHGIQFEPRENLTLLERMQLKSLTRRFEGK
jgi:hypothetical protein